MLTLAYWIQLSRISSNTLMKLMSLFPRLSARTQKLKFTSIGKQLIHILSSCLLWVALQENLVLQPFYASKTPDTFNIQLTVIRYLMRTEKMTFDEAIELVRKNRSLCKPNEGKNCLQNLSNGLGFEQQLRAFEKKILA